MPFDALPIEPELRHIRRIEAEVLPPIYAALRRLGDLDVAEVIWLHAEPANWMTALDWIVVDNLMRALAGEPRALVWVTNRLDLGVPRRRR
jgi:hypothetical protein